MKDVLKNIANLIKVKTLVTFMVVLVFCVMALRGDIPADMTMMITLSVISFYFGTQHEKKIGKGE